jgi:hypothetical protein
MPTPLSPRASALNPPPVRNGHLPCPHANIPFPSAAIVVRQARSPQPRRRRAEARAPPCRRRARGLARRAAQRRSGDRAVRKPRRRARSRGQERRGRAGAPHAARQMNDSNAGSPAHPPRRSGGAHRQAACAVEVAPFSSAPSCPRRAADGAASRPLPSPADMATRSPRSPADDGRDSAPSAPDPIGPERFASALELSFSWAATHEETTPRRVHGPHGRPTWHVRRKRYALQGGTHLRFHVGRTSRFIGRRLRPHARHARIAASHVEEARCRRKSPRCRSSAQRSASRGR